MRAGFAIEGNPNDSVDLALPWLEGISERASAAMSGLLWQAEASAASDEAKGARAPSRHP